MFFLFIFVDLDRSCQKYVFSVAMEMEQGFPFAPWSSYKVFGAVVKNNTC